MGQGQHFTCDFTQANTCPILTHHITPIYVREIVGDLMNVKGSSYFEMTPGSHKEMWGPVSWFTTPKTIWFTVSVEWGLPTRQDWQGAMLYKLLIIQEMQRHNHPDWWSNISFLRCLDSNTSLLKGTCEYRYSMFDGVLDSHQLHFPDHVPITRIYEKVCLHIPFWSQSIKIIILVYLACANVPAIPHFLDDMLTLGYSAKKNDFSTTRSATSIKPAPPIPHFFYQPI